MPTGYQSAQSNALYKRLIVLTELQSEIRDESCKADARNRYFATRRSTESSIS